MIQNQKDQSSRSKSESKNNVIVSKRDTKLELKNLDLDSDIERAISWDLWLEILDYDKTGMWGKCSKTWWYCCIVKWLQKEQTWPNWKSKLQVELLQKNLLVSQIISTFENKSKYVKWEPHNIRFSMFWKDCDSKIWSDCIEDHWQHKIISLNNYYKEKEENMIKSSKKLKIVSNKIKDILRDPFMTNMPRHLLEDVRNHQISLIEEKINNMKIAF